MVSIKDRSTSRRPRKKEISWQAVYHHYQKWSKDGSLEKVWEASIQVIKDDLDTSEITVDGTHVYTKKGGEATGYQYRRRGMTTNVLPLMDRHGFIIGQLPTQAGNHHDVFEVKDNLKTSFKKIKRLGIQIKDAYFNADSAFDTKAIRKICFNYGLKPNIAMNTRNQKKPKRGRPRLFNEGIYKHRFPLEHVFAWVDKFRMLERRYEKRLDHFMGAHFLAFTMINLRHVFAQKV